MVVRFNDTLVRVIEGESEEVCAVLDSRFSISESPPVTIELTPGFAMGMCTLCMYVHSIVHVRVRFYMPGLYIETQSLEK